MSACTKNSANSTHCKEKDVLRNTTTTSEQPPNEFVLENTKKVAGKLLPAVKTQWKVEPNKLDSFKYLKKDSNKKNLAQLKGPEKVLEQVNMESSRSLQKIEDFSKKKLERDQEIREIQEMLNKMKSPHKISERSSKDSENDTKEENSAKSEAIEPVTAEENVIDVKENDDIPFYGRCKTDMQLITKPTEPTQYRVARRDTARSGSSTAVSHKPRSKSSQYPSSAQETKDDKKISYNPEEARRYMQMQRKQRKLSLFKDPAITTKIEKEEIRKRLENLKKNTRKLIRKNIQKKEKVICENLTNKATESEILTKTLQEKKQDEKLEKEYKSSSTELQRPNGVAKVSSKNIPSHRSKNESANNILKPATAPFTSNHKRIGLLRKSGSEKDFSYTSHRSYNFDKENQNLELLTKKLMHKEKNNTQNKELVEKQPEIRHEEDKLKSNLEVSNNNSKTTNSDGKTNLVTRNESLEEDSPKPNELPYWLRPSATQVYPYNFIVAVRRKLESIAQPITTFQQSDDNQQNQETSTTGLNSPSSQKKRKCLELLEEKPTKKLKNGQEKEEDVREKVLEGTHNESTLKQLKHVPQDIQINDHKNKQQDKKEENENGNSLTENVINSSRQHKSIKYLDFQYIKHLNKSKYYKQAAVLKPLQKSLQTSSLDQEDYKQNLQQCKLPENYKSMESLNSEINSNISSISAPMPISNTLTEVSSLITESMRTYANPTKSADEVSSLSSQICSSPEKNSTNAQKEFEFVKPRPVSPLSLEKVDKLKIERKQSDKGAENEMDFTQLLEDFNRSLTHVIQVNEQLKSSLDKSQQISGPHSSKKYSETDKQYSSDFEKSTTTTIFSSKRNERFKETLEKSNENLKERKRQLFEIGEKVKPLLTSQKSENEEHQKTISTNKSNLSNLNLNLKSLTNSTATTDEEGQKTPQTGPADEEQTSASMPSGSYEERLYEIEKLKETLKQTILESRKKRHEKEQKKENGTVAQTRIQKETKFFKCNSQNLSKSEPKTENNSAKGNEMQLNENVTEVEHFSSDKEIFSNSFNESQTLQKYKKLHKNNENLKTLEYENGPNQSQDEAAKVNNNNRFVGKSHKIADYTNFHNISDKNASSSQHHHTQRLQNNNSSQSSGHGLKNKVSASERESNSATQSEIVSTTQSKEETKTYSVSKADESEADAISSSIAEELQQNYGSGSYENENIPLMSKTKSNEIKNLNEANESIQFIKSHINRKRGDFQENISKAAQFNETQFQQAIEASQISSTEFAQSSADDEITSSVISKPCDDVESNTNSNNADTSGRISSRQFLSTFSPPKENTRFSIGNEIVKFVSPYDSERSERQNAVNNATMSESSVNYSNLGMFEKLIQNETNKSQHLTALLKMREKALLDRTKGQIAWLEVQKARYKARGLMNHIAAIRKKQRGILLKMEKEREEIKRLLYTTTSNSKSAAEQSLHTVSHRTVSQQNTPTKYKKERLPFTATPHIKPKVLGQNHTVKIKNDQSSSPILRATHELESSRAVEELLKQREDDLKKRRQHVERLMQWHQRLDEEEAEVLNLERQLLSYNNVPHMVEQQQSKLPSATISAIKEKLTTPVHTSISTTLNQPGNVAATKTPEKIRASRARKMEKRLKEIDKSLKELSHISAAASTTSLVMGQPSNEKEDSVSSVATQEVDFVRTTGLKLNKLWKRLTSQQIEKFEPERRYKLCKSDLERLYEEAKMAVLRDFAEDEERIAKELLDKTDTNLSSTTSPAAGPVVLPATIGDSNVVEVPTLNLNFSSGHSEAEEESANNSQHNATQQGNYSPSVAEENFKAQVLLNSSASSETVSEPQMADDEKKEKPTSRLENNVQIFLALSQRMQACGQQLQTPSGRNCQRGNKLQRSLSDTEISDVPTKYKANKTTTTSQKNTETIASHSNSSITTTNSSARSSDALAAHQRSKSSIVEITYIPSTAATQTNYTDDISRIDTDSFQENKEKETEKDSENINKLSSNHQSNSRSSIISSVGSITPTLSCQHTSSGIVTITKDSKSTTKVTNGSQCPKQKSTYSGQVGTNSETTAKEISSKLDEISAAVTQLSQMNALLPSYESVTTHSHLKHKSIDETIVNTNDESNLSTDGSSYSFNFENITTDKHSSPGTSSSATSLLNTYSMPQKTLASQTYIKADVSDHNDESKESSSTRTLYKDTGASITLNSTKSKTYTKDDAKTLSKTIITQSALENHILDTYEADFESDLSNVTHIEDITIPNFETTVETTQDNDDDGVGGGDGDVESSSKSVSRVENEVKDYAEHNCTKVSDKTYNAEELQKTLLKADFKSIKDRELLPPPPPPITSSSCPSTATTAKSATTATTSNQTGNNHLMPDIINELELRRHQLLLDNEHLKQQYEHVTAVPYMYVREIPNKPPPPYVPPAHGSPMTTIFPSEDRIKDITYRRTQELYCELLKTEYCNEKGEKLPSVMEEQITNIYERIILDICREYLEEHGEILRDGDPTNFYSQLAFFNPPNRLRCIQDAIYKEVRLCLAMDKSQPKRSQIYSVYGQRAKQDHIGKVIIQEMYDEDDRWCNFHREESEVLHLMVEEMINKNIVLTAKEVFLQEGGTIDDLDEKVEMVQGEETVSEENATNHKFDECLNAESLQQLSQLQTSSVLMETINEGDQTYCINESKPEYTEFNQKTRIEADHSEIVNNTNITPSSTNAVQTCT